jgi:hypothetical protein
MKKLLIIIVVLALTIFVVISIAVSKIQVDITESDLPQDVYESSGNPLEIAQLKLLEIINPLSTEDEYTLTEEFLNYMLLDSIRSNVNDEYDPLNDACTDVSCDVIAETPYGNVEYAFVELNSDNQIVVTVNFARSEYPQVETALFAIFDVEFKLTEFEIDLVLDSLYLNDIEIKKEHLDTVLGYFDAAAIEEMISLGSLDLEEYTYTVSLLE